MYNKIKVHDKHKKALSQTDCSVNTINSSSAGGQAQLTMSKCRMTTMLGFQGFQQFLRMSEGMQPSQLHRLFGDQQSH